MENLIKVFDSLLGDNDTSGEIFECGPRGTQLRPAPEVMDSASGEVNDLLFERALPLQTG